MGNGGSTYEHGVQSCLVFRNVADKGGSMTFVVKTVDKVEDGLPTWLMYKGAISVHQSWGGRNHRVRRIVSSHEMIRSVPFVQTLFAVEHVNGVVMGRKRLAREMLDVSAMNDAPQRQGIDEASDVLPKKIEIGINN